ncbi:hypothetical protein DPMN_032358 [Dreissena polymorpha]|uniref:Tox-ART-HYD1 domain-containing protein n=1 Tax=Dreissena polymorpha TaxID=45954 RepID=A0A9D4M1L1_DREPO|nr:hypothetical protein DPMN_032358 [Dreissena polymorpha]
MAGLQILYHHTDQQSARKILKTKKILRSRGGDGNAFYGEGAYLTSIGPYASPLQVAKNNYDGSSFYYERKLTQTEVIFKLEVKAIKCSEERDIYRTAGDIPMSKCLTIFVRDEEAPSGLRIYHCRNR